MSGPRPICVACRVEMTPAKNNRLVKDPESGRFPSTYWFGDEWRCPVCAARIVTGFGKAISPISPNDARQLEERSGPSLEFAYEPKADTREPAEHLRDAQEIKAELRAGQSEGG